MSGKEKKAAEEAGEKAVEGVMTADRYNQLYLNGHTVISPKGHKYVVRPVDPAFSMAGYGGMLVTIKEVIDEATTKREAAMKRKPKNKAEARNIENDIASKEQVMVTEVMKLKKAMRNVLVAGMMSPKVMDPQLDKRPPANEVPVDDFMIQVTEAMFCYGAIMKLTRGEALDQSDGFPENQPDDGTGS